MIRDIVKIGNTGDKGHFRIVTVTEVETEDELLRFEEIRCLIGDGDEYSFERGRNPEFPNTWFLHITRVKTQP